MTDRDYRDREQSEIKHYALRLYLEAATRILGSTRNLKYIDCCAGPWQSKAADYSDTSFGIAIDVLNKAALDLNKRNKSPRFASLLIELEPEPFEKLDLFARDRNSDAVRIHARNWNFTEHMNDIIHYCSKPNSFPFVLIDPKGWKLAGISQITPLLRLNPGEVLINLMSSFITRFLKDNKTDFSDLLGKDFPELRKFSGAELEFEVVKKYCEIVKKVGSYQYVCALPVMNPDLDTFNFHLIYATRHAKGVKVFKDVERRTESMTHTIRAGVQQRERQLRTGNLELFNPEIQYREKRYQKLTADNKQRAKDSVWQLLQSGTAVNYDRCWAEALQFSAVYESDVRSWIKEWEEKSLVKTLGRRFASEVLKIGGNHQIQLII